MKKKQQKKVFDKDWKDLSKEQKRKIWFVCITIIVGICILIRLILLRRPWAILPVVLLMGLIFYPIIKNILED